MAIAEMVKLRLTGLLYEKDKLMDALRDTGAVEIKDCGETENTDAADFSCERNSVQAKSDFIEKQLDVLTREIENYVLNHKLDKDKELYQIIPVKTDDFMGISSREESISLIASDVEKCANVLSKARNSLTRLRLSLNNISAYAAVEHPFSYYKNTASVRIQLGLIPTEKLGALKAYVAENELFAVEVYGDKTSLLPVALAAYNDGADELFTKATELGFTVCQYDFDVTAKQKAEEYSAEIKAQQETCEEEESALYALRGSVRQLKLLSDYYGYQLEKLTAGCMFRKTQTAFVLEAYVPEIARERVVKAINAASEAVGIEFVAPDKDELPPTLLINNKAVKNFEFVTNMYSSPNYKEFDPNTVMSLFFAAFMGFIMADMGYGLLMIALGFFLGLRSKRDGGFKNLLLVIGYGGIATVIFGALFGSFFGFTHSDFAFVPQAVMPDPQYAMWTISGIRIQQVLIICLFIGIFQIAVAQTLNAYQKMRKGFILDGILDGLLWVVFLIGLSIVIVSMIEEFGHPELFNIGAIIAVGAIVIAALTAGRYEKGFGKVTKGFGAVYGIVNYLSDILSYARLYGLMLSGAIVGSIIDELAVGMMNSPLTVILGSVILVIGHSFNFGMSLLSAYIHDARLQYMEFYGKFYEGDGELFKPLGSTLKYSYLTK